MELMRMIAWPFCKLFPYLLPFFFGGGGKPFIFENISEQENALIFQNETERTNFQLDPGTAAAKILTALNAGESEMCAQAKDSSRHFSSSLLVPSFSCHESGISSASLAQMKSDRDDEDSGYCKSISLIAEAVCLIRFSSQYSFFQEIQSHLWKTTEELQDEMFVQAFTITSIFSFSLFL